ncbi:hypothetical protein E2C01_102818 [Portunus trituberculatus]|uniref:Uncharacterized protein n=1 Tax=Portunus trituberculatus TaxID=210409 RepID=A0A5B7KNN6_PORTR|nr:hypothetical protein [Portunus trituberculatus]
MTALRNYSGTRLFDLTLMDLAVPPRSSAADAQGKEEEEEPVMEKGERQARAGQGRGRAGARGGRKKRISGVERAIKEESRRSPVMENDEEW